MAAGPKARKTVPQEGEPVPPPFRPRALALIAAVALLAFANAADNTFHLDDFYRVVDNPGIQRVAPVSRHFTDPRTMSTLDRITNYRPLLPLTLSFNYWWGGSSPRSYHAVNLAVHVLSALLAYALLLELLRWRTPRPRPGHADAGEAAIAAAALFAVHPVSGIVVNYVSARDLALMLAFLLASLLVYARMRRRGDSAAGWTAALVLAGLSILSKANAVVAPLLVLAFEVLIARQGPRTWGPWLRAAPFALVPAGYFAFTRLVLGFSDLQTVEGTFAPGAYLWTQLGVHLAYLGNFLWPLAIRQMPAVAAVSAAEGVAGLALITASFWLVRRWRGQDPVAAFCVCAYWILMIPESSLLPLHHLRADYRAYPSSVFLFLLAARAAASLVPRKAWIAAAAVTVAFFAATSLYLNRTWRTGETLWTHSVRHGGDEVAHLNLAMSIADRRDPRVKENLERALAMAPHYVLAHVNYGLLLIELREAPRGLEHCREAVRLAPQWAQPHYWLAVAYERLGMTKESAESAITAAELDPANLRYAYEGAIRAQSAGRYGDSVRLLRAVRGRDQEFPLVGFLEAFALQQAGRLEAAIPAYRRYLDRHPGDAQARFNLAHALMTRNECEAAIGEFRGALAARPAYHEVRLHLATCLERVGRGAEAAQERALFAASGKALRAP